MTTDPTALGAAIKRARERKRWTQAQLAERVGVNVKTIDNWENGRTSPRNSLGRLEQVLGIQLDGQPAPGPFDDLYPLHEDWEAGVLADGRLPEEFRRRMVLDSRAARSAARERRAAREAARSTDRAAG